MTVLVIGATGTARRRCGARLGGTRRAMCGAMTRAARESATPDGVADVVRADLGDPDSLAAACAGVHACSSCSSPTQDQVELETNAIAAAESGRGRARIVKVSNISIRGPICRARRRAARQPPGDRARLAASPVERRSCSRRSSRRCSPARSCCCARRLVFPTGDGGVAWIDPRDIAAVAAAVLADTTVHGRSSALTGPEALTAAERRSPDLGQ